jgi:hypothetical protein
MGMAQQASPVSSSSPGFLWSAPWTSKRISIPRPTEIPTDARRAHGSHLCFEHLGTVVINGFRPLPPWQHSAFSVDSVFKIGFSDVPVTAAEVVGVTVGFFFMDDASRLWMAGAGLFATFDSSGGEEEEEQW